MRSRPQDVDFIRLQDKFFRLQTFFADLLNRNYFPSGFGFTFDHATIRALTEYLVVLDFKVIIETPNFGSFNQPLVPQVPFLDGFEEEYAFVNLTQLYLDPPVLDAVDFLIGHGQAQLEGVEVTDRQVIQ